MPRETREINVAKNAKVFPVCFVPSITILSSSGLFMNFRLHHLRKDSLLKFFEYFFQISMAYGKQALGLEIKLSGQAVVRDFEMNVPYYPMIGKQEMIVTLSPGTDPQKYVEVQFQLMKRMSQSKQPTSEESSSVTGLLSWVSSLVGSDQSDQSSSFSSSSSSSSPPKDIRSKDTSLKDLLEHLKGSQSVHPDGSVVTRNNSMGFIFNVIGIDQSRSIKRHLQVSMAAGMDSSSKSTSILLSINRSPIPTMETKPWNVSN